MPTTQSSHSSLKNDRSTGESDRLPLMVFTIVCLTATLVLVFLAFHLPRQKYGGTGLLRLTPWASVGGCGAGG